MQKEGLSCEIQQERQYCAPFLAAITCINDYHLFIESAR
jgi:hypothetical protein